MHSWTVSGFWIGSEHVPLIDCTATPKLREPWEILSDGSWIDRRKDRHIVGWNLSIQFEHRLKLTLLPPPSRVFCTVKSFSPSDPAREIRLLEPLSWEHGSGWLPRFSFHFSGIIIPADVPAPDAVEWEEQLRKDRDTWMPYHDWCQERGWEARAAELQQRYGGARPAKDEFFCPVLGLPGIKP